MPSSYASLHVHIVFSTKHRMPDLVPGTKEAFQRFITTVAKDRGAKVVAIDGFFDHLHLLLEMRVDHSIAKLVQTIKSVSSKWARRKLKGCSQFSWQPGYGAFAVSRSIVPAVKRYIENQEKKHRTISFEEEFVGLLVKHQVDFDPKWLWKG